MIFRKDKKTFNVSFSFYRTMNQCVFFVNSSRERRQQDSLGRLHVHCSVEGLMVDFGIFRSISYYLQERKCFFEWFVSTFQVLHPLVFHFWSFFAGEPSKIDCFWRNIELWQPKMKSFSCKIIFFETYLKTSVLTVSKVPKRNINTKCWIILWNTKKTVFLDGFHQCKSWKSNTKGCKLLGLKQLVSSNSFAFVEYLT